MSRGASSCSWVKGGVLAAAFALGATGCWVSVPLDGKACDESHPCVDGFSCWSGTCVSSGDGGPLADAGRHDAGRPDEDAGGPDSGPADSGPADSGVIDSGVADDGGGRDGGDEDAGDAAADDAGAADAGAVDAGPFAAAAGEWWDRRWPYRVDVVFDAGARARMDYPVDVELNLPALLAEAGIASFDERSPRVVEHDATGRVLAERPSYFFFDPISGDGVVFFALRGVTPAGGERRFSIYFADDSEAIEEGAPPYWQSRVQPITWNNNVVVSGLGRDADGTASGLSLKTFEDLAGRDTVFHRAAKILSSDGDYGSSTGSNGNDPATAVFGIELPSTRRLRVGNQQLFETVVNAGSLRLREFTWLGDQRIVRHLLRVENAGAQHVAGLRFFVVIDTDLDDSSDDTAAYVEEDDVVYASDPSRSVTKVVGVRAVPRSESHSVDLESLVFEQARDGALPGGNAATGDIGIGAAWTLPDLPPGEAATLRHQLALADSYALLRAALLDYADVPAMTLSAPLVPGPPEDVSPPPQIIDFVASPSVQVGEPAVLVWTTRAASACTLTGPGYDGAVPPRGSLAVVPTVSFGEDASFTLRCAGGEQGDAQAVKVVPVSDEYWVHSAADLPALAGLTYVEDLQIRYTDLSDLSGLSALTTVGDDLIIEDNHALTSLAGLDGLTTVGDDIEIVENPLLPTCAANELLGRVTVAGSTWVDGTDDDGTCP